MKYCFLKTIISKQTNENSSPFLIILVASFYFVFLETVTLFLEIVMLFLETVPVLLEMFTLFLKSMIQFSRNGDAISRNNASELVKTECTM